MARGQRSRICPSQLSLSCFFMASTAGGTILIRDFEVPGLLFSESLVRLREEGGKEKEEGPGQVPRWHGWIQNGGTNYR